MNAHRLTRAAFFMTNVSQPWLGWILPKGTLVSDLPNAESPLTGTKTERHVTAPDPFGRPWPGWIAATTKMRSEEHLPDHPWPKWSSLSDWKLNPWDQIRRCVTQTIQRSGADKRGDPVEHWTVLSWSCGYGIEHKELLRAALQYVGRAQGSAPSVHNLDLIHIIYYLTKLTSNQEVTMAKVKKTRKAVKSKISKAKKKASKKAAAQEAAKAESLVKGDKGKDKRGRPKASGRSMAQSVGTKLTPLLKKGRAPKTVQAMASKLAKGDSLGTKQFQSLRDSINEVAVKFREKGNTDAAANLSNLNRLVRRMHRASRK